MPTVLIISHRAEFTVDAIARALHEEGFETISSDPVVENISRKEKDADIIVVYAGSYIESAPEILTYIRDVICTVGSKPFCAIGSNEQLWTIESVIPRNLIAGEFSIPIDMPRFVSTVSGLVKMAAPVSDKHILLVDDDLMFLKMMQEWLTPKYRVTILKSGAQAVAYTAKHTPDLMLLDYDMPITSGPQVMKMMKSEDNSKNIPIMFLTGKSDKESVMDVMRLKPEGYLLKSMSREQMTSRIDEYFNSL